MNFDGLNNYKPNFPPTNEALESSGKSKNLNDQSLWMSFKSGNEESFILIYKEYANIVYSYGCQFTSDHELVKDCLQDFFVYLREKRSGLGETSSIKLYLFKAFKRRVIEYLKKHSKEIEKNEFQQFLEFPMQMSHESIYIQQQLEEDQLSLLDGALKSLEAKEREAVYYFYFEGLSYDQIAQLLDFSHVSSARRIIYRALANLRKIMIMALLGFLTLL